jgi:hypothetical protein
VLRSACSDAALHKRRTSEIAPDHCCDQTLAIDGYNLLITLESALGGGVLLLGRDGCCRDLASLHGTYRAVEETIPALEIAGAGLEDLSVAEATWYLDAPVSNSGRLGVLIRTLAAERGWPWQVRIASNVDPLLAATESVIASTDSWILDRTSAWLNLARLLVERYVPLAAIIFMNSGDTMP